MRTLKVVLMLLLCTSLGACAFGQKKIVPREVASPAKIGLKVDSEALLAFGLGDDTLAELQSAILASRIGVPVSDASHGDLVLHVTITGANLTKANAWNWTLTDPESGAIVLSKTDTSIYGVDGDGVAESVVASLMELDTAAYAGEGGGVILPSPATPQPALTPPKSDNDGDKAFAVVIGIESYREKLSPATGAEVDARAFADFAQTTLGVPEANIKVLIGERASRADLTGALLEWLPRNAVEPGGKVYVFFSGHGAPDVETGDAYLVPYDANPAYIKTGGLSMKVVQETLAGLNGQEAYLFMDSCFSGTGDRSVLAEGTRPLVPVKPIESKGSLVTLSASAADQTTGAHEGSGHGLFTYHLLHGMTGAADANADSNITLQELASHITAKVKVEARRQNRDQTPTVAAPGSLDQTKAVFVKGLQ